MKRKYEGVYVLKMKGQEEGIDDLVSSITTELEAQGADLEMVDRLGRKEFANENHAKQKAGYYVQLHFNIEPAGVDQVETKLKLNENIMLQHYRRLG